VLPHTRHIDLCRQDTESSYHADNMELGTGTDPPQHSAIYTQIFNVNKRHFGKQNSSKKCRDQNIPSSSITNILIPILIEFIVIECVMNNGNYKTPLNICNALLS
jgi:hypothetical protein